MAVAAATAVGTTKRLTESSVNAAASLDTYGVRLGVRDGIRNRLLIAATAVLAESRPSFS